MIPKLDDDNWSNAFHEAIAGEHGDDSQSLRTATIPKALPEDDVSVTGFCRDDVAEIAGLAEGEHDEDDWLVYGRLRDGRWFSLRDGCDYTGWD